MNRSDKTKAREFCKRVSELAKEYGLNVFVVTDGASYTSNDDNDCIYLHRRVQTAWEIDNGLNPEDDWTPKTKK